MLQRDGYFKIAKRPVYYNKWGYRKLANNRQWLSMLYYNLYVDLFTDPLPIRLPDEVNELFTLRFNTLTSLDLMIESDLRHYTYMTESSRNRQSDEAVVIR